MNLRERETQLSMIMVGALLYLVSPLAFWLLLKSEWDSGVFPADSDSIGIPMAGFLLLWSIGIVTIPLVAISIVGAGRILLNNKADKSHEE